MLVIIFKILLCLGIFIGALILVSFLGNLREKNILDKEKFPSEKLEEIRSKHKNFNKE